MGEGGFPKKYQKLGVQLATKLQEVRQLMVVIWLYNWKSLN